MVESRHPEPGTQHEPVRAAHVPGAPHLRLRFVEHVRMRRLRIEAIARPVEAHIDGEPDLMTPLQVEPLGRVMLLGVADVESARM